jgi:peroxiredoxin
MTTFERQTPVQPGEPAPNFTLPAADREGTVSLEDYRGKSAVLLALFRGLFCPLCRRHIGRLGMTREKLRAVGVEVLGVVATRPERARLYFRHRPPRVMVAADPELMTHRSYGVPRPALTPELAHGMQSTGINPFGEWPEPLPIWGIWDALNPRDGFEMTDIDREDTQRQAGQGAQLIGQFLVDRDGIVRWVNVEGAKEGLPGVGKFPTDEELLAAAQQLAR